MLNKTIICGVCFLVSFVRSFPSGDIKSPYVEGTKSKFHPRESWGALPGTNTKKLTLPVPYVVIHHTYIPGACNTTEQCSADMRSMQTYHMGLGWGDIGYNFCVGGEGGAYEGRGWSLVGAHARQANRHSIGICLIGDWRYELPPQIQLDTARALIEEGVEKGIISPEYKLIGHSQATPTECPGVMLLNHISKWDHYVPGNIEF